MTASNANQSRNLTTDLEKSFVECHVTAEVKIKAFQVSLGNCEVFLSSEADHCDFGSATRTFLLTFVSIEMSGSSPLRLLLRSISWTFEGFFHSKSETKNDIKPVSKLSGQFWELWKVMLDYEDSWLSKRLQLFVQQGEVRLMGNPQLELTMAFIPNAAFQVVAPPPNTQWQCWEEFQKTPKELVGKPSSSSNLEFLKPDGFQLSKRFRKSEEMTTWREVADALRRCFSRKSSPET